MKRRDTKLAFKSSGLNLLNNIFQENHKLSTEQKYKAQQNSPPCRLAHNPYAPL